MTEIRFGGRCEKHLCPKPCTKCAERLGMTTITVPKQTWDALREALKHGIREMNLSGKAKECMPLHHALTAANAVSEPVGINGLTKAETSASMSVMGLSKPTVQPQAQGLTPESARAMVAEMDMNDRVLAAIDAEPQAQREIEEWLDANRMQTIGSLHHELVARFASHSQQATEPAWRPIESAPKYKEVLVYRDDSGPFVAKLTTPDGVLSDDELAEMDFPDDFEEWFSDAYGWQEKDQKPTHWMPLPAAPEAKQ